MGFSVRDVSVESGTATQFTIAAPTGTDQHDDLVLLLFHEAATQIGVAPSWSLESSEFGAQTLRFLRYQGAALNGPWTFTFTDGLGGPAKPNKFVAAIVGIERADSTSYITISADTLDASASSNTTAVAPSVSPADDPTILLNAVGWPRGTTWTADAVTTEIVDESTGSGADDLTLSISTDDIAAAGATGTRTFANDNPYGHAAAVPLVASIAIASEPPADSWNGDLSTGDFSQWEYIHRADTDRIVIGDDEDEPYATFTVLDDDVYPLTPTANPRSQLDGPLLLFDGFTRWVSWGVRIPEGFPTLDQQASPQDWLALMQLHGPPFSGPPSIAMWPMGRHLVFTGTNNWFATPIRHGQWMDFAARIHFSQDDEVGWVEMWMDGARQRLLNGKLRMYGATMMPDQFGGLFPVATHYRRHGLAETLSLALRGFRVDTDPPPGLDFYGRPPVLTSRVVLPRN